MVWSFAELRRSRRRVKTSVPFLITTAAKPARTVLSVALLALAGLSLLLWRPAALRSDNFIIYQVNSRAPLTLQIIDQAHYLPILAVLNTVGKVGAIQEKRKSLKVWFGENEIELRLDDKRVRVGKSLLTLAQPVRRPHGQWLVPVEFLIAALPQLTHQVIEYKAGGNRIFIGDVRPLTFSLRMDPTSNGARLSVQCSEKVAVRTAASNGKWFLYLGDRPVLPLEQSYRFQNPYVSEVQFDDQDGVPKLIITPTTGGLNFYPSTAEGGKILLADILKPPPPAQEPVQGSQATVATAPSVAAPPSPEQPEPGVPGPPLPVVVLDAAHGAEDTGARARDGVLEKDLTAQLAAKTRLALLATRKYRVQLTRVGDISLNFEQRETAANTLRPIAFISFHAGDLGNTSPRIAIFNYRAFPAEQPATPSLLIPWANAQQGHMDQSRKLAQSLQEKFTQIPGLSADRASEAPVRSLRSIDAPAVAVEVGSLNADQDSGPLTSPSFQQQVATAIVAGLEAFRGAAP